MKLNRIIFALAATALLAAGCMEKPEEGSEYGDIAIFFGADELTVEAGGTLSVPFSILGSEGVVLNLEAVTSDAEVTTKLKYDATYTGTIEFTAPIVVAGQKDVTLTLKVSDKKGRKAENSTTVTMLASEPLALALTDNIRSMATTAGGTFTLPVVLTGKGNATVPDNVTISASNGWTASYAWNSDKTGGMITVTAPAALTDNVTISMSLKDSYDREATLEVPLSIVAISVAENAANCHIVAPGSTITINAVKGNSTEALDFNNATLVWQDELGLVKSVAGNGAAKAVVVELNAGKSGNAVVAAKKDGVIVWSWHLWVTDFDPEADPFVYKSPKTGTTYTFMDRNLGADSNEQNSAASFGLLYQWGRKDPFVGADGVESSVYVKKYDIDGNIVREVTEMRPVYEDFTTTNLELSIQNPTVFYKAPQSAWPVVDWLTDDAQLQNNDLWGGVSGHKTIYDPCPEGWTVPTAGDPWLFRSEYKKIGTLQDDGKYDESYPWYIEYEPSLGFRYKTTDGKEYWFPFQGKKEPNSGELTGVGGGGQLHTRSVSNTTVSVESFAWGNPASESPLNRPYGSGVRCIKEN